jgi:hypothetical protein
MSDGSGGLFGGGFDLSSLFGSSPQAMQQTPLSPQGIPTGLDQAASVAGLPSLSSIVQGVNNDGSAAGGWGVNAQGQPVAQGQSQPVGSRLGGLLQQIAGGAAPAVQGLQKGTTSPSQFLQAAMGAAKQAIGGMGGAGGGGGGGGGGGASGGGAAPTQGIPGWHPQNPMAGMGLGTMAAQQFGQRYQPQQQAIQPASALNPVRF